MESKCKYFGKVRKTENYATDEDMKDREEEILRKSIIKDFTMQIREKHATLAEVGEEDRRFLCIDDVTVKELTWLQVRQAL